MITSSSETEFLRHTISTLAYRGRKAVEQAPNGFAELRVGPGTRTPGEILSHIGDVLEWALMQVEGREAWSDSGPGSWADEVDRFFAVLEKLDQRLASGKPSCSPVTRVFQGPIADALTHVGQVAMLRRLADSPVRGDNYYQADIEIGRVGRKESAPRREFD